MVKLVYVLFVIGLHLPSATGQCGTKMPVPKLDERDRFYQAVTRSSFINDRLLPEGWYGTGDQRTLLDTAPGTEHCGTQYPIWRKQKDGVTSTMCVQTFSDACFRSFTIKTMMCGTTEIFHLTKAPYHLSAYCFGLSANGETPPSLRENPELEKRAIQVRPHKSDLEIQCKFKKVTEDVFYKTIWTVNDVTIVSTEMMKWENGDVIKKHALSEQHLRDNGITKLGFRIRCSVRASSAPDKPLGAPVTSNDEFIGIKISNSTLTIRNKETENVSLELTVPFGCGQNQDPATCMIYVEALHIGNQGDCGEAKLKSSTCGIIFPVDNWSQPQTLTVVGVISQQYSKSTHTTKLKLKTAGDPSGSLWNDYSVGTVNVQLTRDSTAIKGKSCYCTNDPHMKTFDGRYYEHQFGGTYTLYKHGDLPVEVQIQTRSCVDNGKSPFCNCGVVVGAGKTVFEISHCDPQTRYPIIEYTNCDENGEVLQVKKNGRKYVIYLPTGGYVDVYLYGRSLNVYMYPSVYDIDNSFGLCGKLSDVCSDDFVLRDRSYATDPTSREGCRGNTRATLEGFSKSWSVPEKENLFKGDFHLNKWAKRHTYCSCPNTATGNQLNPKVTCSAVEAVDICAKLPGYQPVKCSIQGSRKRRRRSTRQNGYIRVEREVRESWTEDEAKSHCMKLFDDSAIVKRSLILKDVDTQQNLENCVLDIMLSKSTEFGVFAIDSVYSKTVHEVVANPDLQHNYDEIIFNTCTGDCSGRGQCVRGECVCEEDYGGQDCSIDLRSPPKLAEVAENGLCDTSRDSCDVISVYGETFVEATTMCSIEELRITFKSTEAQGYINAHGSTQSIGEVLCTLPTPSDAEDSEYVEYVRGYRISVTNKGDFYSRSLGLMVYDGTCITALVDGTDFKWTIEGAYCVYKGRCVAHMAQHPAYSWLVCHVSGSKRAWIKKSPPPQPPYTDIHVQLQYMASIEAETIKNNGSQ